MKSKQQADSAFVDLVYEHQGILRRICCIYASSPEDREDLYQEILMQSWRSFASFNGRSKFSTWLYRLSANHAVDHIRRRRKERGRTEMPAQVADPAVGAGASLESDERARLLRDALVDLSVPYREAIELVYVEGLRVDDAAARLGIPSGTVKTRLMRGREALRRILARRHPEHFGDTDAL